MNLSTALNYLNGESLITIYVNNKLIAPDVPPHAFPDRHDLNIYYSNEVLEIRAISKDRFGVYLKDNEV